MKLLNGLVLRTRTRCSDFGNIISELGHIDFYGKHRPIIYYDKGLEEIDFLFQQEEYFKQEYVTNLISQENSFDLLFMKYDGEYCTDMGGLYISRNDIIDFKEFEASNIEVIKDENVKERMNYMWKKGGGVLGSLTGNLTNKLIKLKTQTVDGSFFVLSYYNKENTINELWLYTSTEYAQNVFVFLNSYFKKTLPKEAINKMAGSNNNCFIATACYKDYYSKEVICFREFRDFKLSKSFIGKVFIKMYYIISPFIYKPLLHRPKTSKKIKWVLDKLYLKLEKRK